MNETDLYLPIKKLFEDQEFSVKGEVKKCDIVAINKDGLLVIVELKLRFSLALIIQGIERQKISNMVYVAFLMPAGRRGKIVLNNARKICKRLKLGLITVRLQPSEFVKVHLEPSSASGLRINSKKRSQLLNEHYKLLGDPNIGGQVGNTIMTAYRQDAIQVAIAIKGGCKGKPSLLAETLGIPNARSILYNNHYDWFVRIERGLYGLSEKGEVDLKKYEQNSVGQDL